MKFSNLKSPHLPLGLETEMAVRAGCCKKAEHLLGVGGGTVSWALYSVSCPRET